MSAQHVIIVVFENQNFDDMIGSPDMPYFNTLAQQKALATQYYASTHPSIGNYFMLTAGTVLTNDGTFPGTFNADNVASRIAAAGKTWKMYAQSLPAVGYVGGDQYPYVKHHNPFAYYDNVINDPAQKRRIVPFSQFRADVDAGTLPNYSFVIPNEVNNGHDCPDGTDHMNCSLSARVGEIDNWLKNNFQSLIEDANFMKDTIVILTLDESATDDTRGGGRIPTILMGAGIKTNFQSSNVYQHDSLLRFSLEAIGVNGAPGQGANAPGMGEFLQ
ncbi:MAG TPA: alkaline phosphatase family protein [Terriglobales bacterium]|nr:alkaline phosphatase family protein [Terriglobales bacterium]